MTMKRGRRPWQKLLIAGWLMGACSGEVIGTGLGFAAPVRSSKPATTALRLVQVMPTGDTDAFVQLHNAGVEPLDVRIVQPHLLGIFGDWPLGDEAALQSPSPVWQPDERRTVRGPQLHRLAWQSGELALVDATYQPQSYVAWGTAQGQQAPTLAAWGAAVDTAAFLPVPFVPPDAATSLNFDAPAPACAVADPNRTAVAPAISCEGGLKQAPLHFGALSRRSAAGLISESFVEIVNVTARSIDVFGVMFCRAGRCQPLLSHVIVAPQSSSTAPLSQQTFELGARASAAQALPTKVSQPTLGADEELALAAPGFVVDGATQPASNTPSDLWSYVRTGMAAPSSLAAAAQQAGMWQSDTATSAIPQKEQGLLSYDAAQLPGPAAWRLIEPEQTPS